MKLKPLPSQERIRALLNYDPVTGVFTWIPRFHKGWKQSLNGTVAGTRGAKGIVIYIDGEPFYAHRLAWVYMHGDVLDTETQVDHRDCDCFNNPIDNLRPATHGQNAANSRQRKGKDLPKGVSIQTRSGRFRARIGSGKSVTHIGTFDTPEEAHAAYLQAAREAKGEFARAG